MKFKIVLDEQDMKRISLEQVCLFVKRLNMNPKADARIERIGDDCIEIVVSKRNGFKELCDSLGIMHFDSKEDWINWIRRKYKK